MEGVAIRRRPRSILTALLGAALVVLCGAPAHAAPVAGLAGRVMSADSPVSDAAVYAYQVVDRSFRKVADLPAGLYKIVAHKIGIPPAILVLARRAAEDSQYVQVELPRDENAADDYWTMRSEIPSDVLRDLEPGAIDLVSAERAPTPSFQGGVVAQAGMRDLGEDMQAEVAGAQVDLNGQLGRMRLKFEGEFENLAASSHATTTDGIVGRSTIFKVDLTDRQIGHFGFAGRQHQRIVGDDSGRDGLDFSTFQLRYVNEFGSDARRSTDVSAQYLDESGLHGSSPLAPQSLPEASRLLTVQGNYAQLLGDRARIEAGMRYRAVERLSQRLAALPDIDRYLDLWSTGRVDVQPTVVLEYGLYSTLRDGSVSLLPRGGFVLRLTPTLQASLSASHRFVATEHDPLEGDFTPLLFQGALACEGVDSTCYQAELLHGEGQDNSLRVRSSWRQFDRTVRLFLRDDFYAGGEGIYFVPGDRLPEVQATLKRRLGDSVVASWNSSYAAGGGGVFHAANRNSYENEVVYIAASLDTMIEPTATGIFLAFQRVEQRLQPVSVAGVPLDGAEAGLERVELALSQDLSTLFDLATNWAVRVGMEVVRGDTLLEPAADPDEFRRRLTTSVAVRF